jgi:uncharacterized protein YeaO (DUF488 family)
MPIRLKRVYEKPSPSDGTRVLVDRLWPRGVTKRAAALHSWLKDLGPSHALRRWFHARPRQWQMFRKRYLEELRQPEAEQALEELYELAARRRPLTLVFSARNTEQNNAAVLKQLLEGMRKPPSSSGAAAAASVRGRARASRRS